MGVLGCGARPYLWLDATYVKVRDGGRITVGLLRQALNMPRALAGVN